MTQLQVHNGAKSDSISLFRQFFNNKKDLRVIILIMYSFSIKGLFLRCINIYLKILLPLHRLRDDDVPIHDLRIKILGYLAGKVDGFTITPSWLKASIDSI